MHARRSLVCVVGMLLSLSACGAPASSSDAATSGDAVTSGDAAAGEDVRIDAATTSDAAVGADGAPDPDASMCTTVLSGPAITSTTTIGEPMATGGTIVDGDYRLESATAYAGAGVTPPARTIAGAIRFRGTQAELVLTERGETTAVSGTFSTSRTNVSLTWTCPRPAPARRYPYNATATRFEWFLPPNMMLVFVKQ